MSETREGLTRRSILQLGAAGAAAAALSACSSGGGGADEPTTTILRPTATDKLPLQTGTALELLILDVYDKAEKSGLLTTPAIAEAAKLFTQNHKQHLELFQTETAKLAGAAITRPHQALASQLEGRVAGVHDETAVVGLLLDLERVAAATYQGDVGFFSEQSHVLNQVVMSVAGIAARQAAVWAGLLGQPMVPSAVSATTGALTPGSGL